MPEALPHGICHGDYRLGNMLCDGAEVSALIDWEIWSLSDPRLDLAWFLFFTEEAKHPMASNFGPTDMPSDVCALRRLRRCVRSRAGEPRMVPLLDPLQGGCGDRALMKRAVKSGAADAGGNWVTAIPALTVECIERLQKFEPSR